MARILYHLHIDAARIPEPLISWATQEAGFHFDDFPHHFKIEGQEIHARHLTKYIVDPATAKDVKKECQRIKEMAETHNLQGFIQAEFIVQESEWKGAKGELPLLKSPLKVKMRPLDPEKGEEFKRHEIHLELSKKSTSPSIITALKEAGFYELDDSENITFTCSGHPKELGLIKDGLENFLNSYSRHVTGKLVYEATAFWSLHEVGQKHLPSIVDTLTP